MFFRYFAYLKRTDWLIFSLILLLLSLSLLSIYSTTMNQDVSVRTIFTKQLVFVIVGIVCMFGVSMIDFRHLRAYSPILYLIGLTMLGVVLVFGKTIHGTTGWLFIGSYGIQPVEFVKIILIIVLAQYVSQHGQDFYRPRRLIVSGLLTLVYVGLVLAEPDLGSAIIYFIIWLGFLLLLNVRRSYIVAVLLLVVVVASLGWAFVLKDYQKDRIVTFLNPSHDPLSTGYNLRQSIVAIGSGQIFGRGLGFGTQSQLKFLPEQQTDFIFAVIGEELGLIGTAFTLAIFALLFFRFMRVVRKSRDDFSLFLTIGIMFMIFSQMLINIGMNLGLAPVIGLPLPFVSAGGSSLLTNCIAVGIVQAIITHRSTS
ncbi:MAG: rod shape-determining protein RodA [Patescibacteria group bacterium]